MPRRSRRDEVPATRGRQQPRKPPTPVEEISARLLQPDAQSVDGFVVKGTQGASKRYLCPWCQGWIEPGVRHIVAYPTERLDERRHYHSGCWQKRAASER